MREFDPPIPERGTEELIEIANGTSDQWQQEAIDQAKTELLKRGIANEQQQRVIERWKKEEEEFQKRLEVAYQNQVRQNETEGYTTGKMICIFLGAPFILLGKLRVDLSLWNLRKENYQRKFRQRLALLTVGAIFWSLLVLYSVRAYRERRLTEISNVDISE